MDANDNAGHLNHRVVQSFSRASSLLQDLAIFTTHGISGKKNPRQLMDAWDLKMHKPWWWTRRGYYGIFHAV